MIVIDEKKLAFLHIPKCGGTTIQKWLRQHFAQSPEFYGKRDHPGVGVVYPEHFTLAQLAAFYPELLDTLKSYDTFVLLRDPIKRFESALGQFANEFRGANISLMTPTQIDALAQDILAQLEALDRGFDFELIHFTPQAAYVEYGSERVARHLRRMSSMQDTLQELSQRLGIPLPEKETRNVRKEFRIRSIAPLLRRLDRLAKSVLPAKLAMSLNEAASRVLQRPMDKARPSALQPATIARIRKIYRRDFELLEEVEKTCMPGPA